MKQYLQKLIAYERSLHILAQSFCVGTYIAFSPFIGGHTIMVFIFCWLFNLNIPVTLAASCGINNPWTAVPVYLLDYSFGYWLVHSVLGIEHLTNPAWMHFVEQLCTKYIVTVKPCLWSFLIGGNLLGIILALLLYPVIKRVFNTLTQNVRTPVVPST